jgi:hypothetical protein
VITTKQDGFGKLMHRRTRTPLDQQDVVRLNRDTLYSAAVFDLDAGPVTVTLPDASKRFMSMQIMLNAIEAMQPARRNCSRHGEIRHSATFVVGVATIRS